MTFQDGPGVAAVAERAIHRELSGPGSEHVEDFRRENRPVGARRGLARGEHFADGLGELGGPVFLVLLVKGARVLAPVARTAAVGQVGGFHEGVPGRFGGVAVASGGCPPACAARRPLSRPAFFFVPNQRKTA